MATTTIAHLAPGLDRAAVRAMILATAHHGAIAGERLDLDTARMLDCDLAILGAPPEQFDAWVDPQKMTEPGD